MKLIFTKDLVPGMLVGREVVPGERVLKLLAEGIHLTHSQISNIQKWGVPFLCIREETKQSKGEAASVAMTAEEFLSLYQDTIQGVLSAFRKIKRFNEVPVSEMKELADQKISLLVNTIGALEYLHNIRCHSEPTFHHSLNVAVVAGILGKWCNFRDAELKNVILAGLLHDIGKVEIPLSILDKPGKLSAIEFSVVKRHPRKGYHLVRKSNELSLEIKQAILQHHERMDGSGYPFGLTGKEIQAGAKVIAVADIYDALTSDRPYRRKMTPFKALDIIGDQIFELLDPGVGLTFLDNMRDYLIGSCVSLSNGEEAKIIAFNAKNKYFTKPVVSMRNGSLINLQEEKISIVRVK